MLGEVQSLDRVSFKFWPPFLTRRRVRHEGSSRLARKDGTAGHGGGGGGAVITDISFQRVSPGYKSSLGRPLLGHCPRESLSFFPSLCFSSLAFFPSVRHPPPSSFPLPLSSSLVGIARPRCDRERKRERERGTEGKEVSLSEFLVRSSVTLSQIHFAVGEFPLVHVPGNRDEGWISIARISFHSFTALFLPLPSSLHSPSSGSIVAFAILPFENGRGEKNFLMDRSLIRTREETSLPLPPTSPPFPFISRKLRGSLCSRIAPTDWSSRIDRNPRRAQGAPLRFGCDSTCVRPNNI